MKNIFKSSFSLLQKIGKALMLPVSVLPIAGLLLGIGSAHFSLIPDIISQVMSSSGDVIFSNLPLIFAISVALGLTNNDGVAALASVVGYGVLIATMGVMAKFIGAPTKMNMGIETINTGVAGGLLIGVITSALYLKFSEIKLPAYLGFFGGKRFIPIITSVAAIASGVILSYIWPPIGAGIQSFSNWAAHENPALAFSLYGLGERTLIPFGLHHILNAPFFFEAGQYIDPLTGKTVTGEIQRFIYGDPSAGHLAGGYLFKMWGLPAAALAMWLTAKPENKKRVGGIMIAAALTSFITGITEPIEFAFLFVAPFLYFIHALLSGLAFLVCILLDIKHGMTFSHGLIDFILLYPKSSNAHYLWLLGPIWGILYFLVFTYFIKKFNLETPGREKSESQPTTSLSESTTDEFSEKLISALGGQNNIKSLDACITRLRIQLLSKELVKQDEFKKLGAAGSVVVGDGIQVIFGPQSENIKSQLEKYIQSESLIKNKLSDVSTPKESQKSQIVVSDTDLKSIFGGEKNIVSLLQINPTRLRVHIINENQIQTELLNVYIKDKKASLVKISELIYHIVLSIN